MFDAESNLAANLYAPHADASMLLPLQFSGALLAKNITVQAATIFCDATIARASGGCPRL